MTAEEGRDIGGDTSRSGAGGVVVSSADRELMRSALEAAPAALPTGDVPIGAVVAAPDGRILASGHNRREELSDPTAHAEVQVLRAAAAEHGDGWRLSGCTLAVTVEPCTMCAGALVLSRVSRVVFGAWEPRTGAVGSLWDVVRDRRVNHRPEVVGGVFAAECARLLEGFFDDQRDVT
ncbi:tRNA(adenine34) deaminase [Actinopolyspora biskrensis]|uniref:tRNA-specific adenosine deaminase n=1 Tax=Actinopolyspora biskrensis TaxID=1470178 RepID=A0A852Z332_9ACTN|nr:tRNA(adenine34) deaminase [Actinopolyspora biskrensis]